MIKLHVSTTGASTRRLRGSGPPSFWIGGSRGSIFLCYQCDMYRLIYYIKYTESVAKCVKWPITSVMEYTRWLLGNFVPQTPYQGRAPPLDPAPQAPANGPPHFKTWMRQWFRPHLVSKEMTEETHETHGRRLNRVHCISFRSYACRRCSRLIARQRRCK